MIEETFLSYKHYRWLWLHLLLLAVLIALYRWDEPIGGRSGNTVLGYSYGILAAAAILYLLWFGLRKRSHYSHLATLKSCLSVHVWLGLSLALIVPLHCAFQFGANVHSLAYLLMLGVIGSGIVGARIYLRLPTKIKSHRGGGTVKALVEEVHRLSQEIEWLARERSDEFLMVLEKVDFNFHPSMFKALLDRKPKEVPMKEVAALLSVLPDTERSDAFKVVAHANRKRQLVDQIQDEVRVMAIFRSWLYVHIPLSYGLVMAVAVHVFSVLYLR